MIRRLGTTVLAVVVATASAVTVAGPSLAGTAPTVTLTTRTPRVNTGDRPTFVYSATGAQPGDSAQLQRRLADGSWSDVGDFVPSTTDRSAQAPVLPTLGRYTYRMQLVDADGTAVATTGHNHDVYAYGDVTIRQLCPHTTSPSSGSRVCARVRTRVGSTTLETRMAVAATIHPNFAFGAVLSNTSCRSASLQFTNAANSTVATWLKLTEPGLSAEAKAPHSSVGSLTAILHEGAKLYFDGSTEGSKHSVFVRGSLSCWTPTGTQ